MNYKTNFHVFFVQFILTRVWVSEVSRWQTHLVISVSDRKNDVFQLSAINEIRIETVWPHAIIFFLNFIFISKFGLTCRDKLQVYA